MYNMYRVLIFMSMACLYISCGGGVTGPKYDLKGYQTDDIGGGAQAASFYDQSGKVLSTGHTIDGVRTGMWTTFHPEDNLIKTMTNYVNGKKNGMEVTLDQRGYVTNITGYRDDLLHGLSGVYKNGRTISETTYAHGVMHGPFTIYDDRNGKIQRSGYMSNGKQHGELLYYNPDGSVSMRYEYSNGEKISGGIITE